MTRPLDEVREVLALRETGLGARRIARRTGIPVKTVQGWITDPERAVLRPRVASGDRLRCDGECKAWYDVPTDAYAYLLGMYLGDGHIIRMKRTYKLSIYCDAKYPGIIGDVTKALSEVLPGHPVGYANRDGCIGVRSHWNHWPCLFPQHGPGVKHDRKIELVDWQNQIAWLHPELLLRGLIHSDGCRVQNFAIAHRPDGTTRRYDYTRYHFSNRSIDIQRIFCDACDRLGVRWKRARAIDITVNRRSDVAILDSFVGPKR